MTNLLMIYDAIEPTNIDLKERIGVFCEQNKISFRARLTAEVVSEDIRWCDLLWSIRIQSKLGAYIIEIAKKNECIILSMYDDDFLALPDYPVRRYFSWQAIMQILQLADYVISYNDSLGKKMSKISKGAKYIRIDTPPVRFNEIHMPVIEHTALLKVVYYMSDGSTGNFESVINPVIKHMPASILSKLELNLIGVKPHVARADEIWKINYIESHPLDEFRSILRNGKFTFGIAPLVANEFTKAKYINKFFEFSMAGLPCIYSNVEPYNLKIVDGYDGILADNCVKDWIVAIDRMRDVEFRRICVLNAQKELSEIYTEDALHKTLREGIKEFSGYQASHMNRKTEFWMAKMKWMGIYVLEPLARAWGRFKIEGLKSVFQWTYEQYIKGRLRGIGR